MTIGSKIMKAIIPSLFSLLFLVSHHSASSQDSEISIEDMAAWKQIKDITISDNGQWIGYKLTSETLDDTLCLHQTSTNKKWKFPRANKYHLNNDFIINLRGHSKEGIKELKRTKTHKDSMPQDTLIILNLNTFASTSIPHVKKFIASDSFPDLLVYQLDAMVTKPDTTKAKNKVKKVNKKNGHHVVLHNLKSHKEDTIFYCTKIEFPKKSSVVLVQSTGKDSVHTSGVYAYNFQNANKKQILSTEGKIAQLSGDDMGQHFLIYVDQDTTKVQFRPYDIHYYQPGNDSTALIITHDLSNEFPGYFVNEDHKPHFAKNGSRFFFKTREMPLIQDTSVIEEEIVDVEVWTTDDAYIYPMQNVRQESDKKKGFDCVYDLKSASIIQIANKEVPNVNYSQDRIGKYALVSQSEPYVKTLTWEGRFVVDVYLRNITNGELKEVKRGTLGFPILSPKNKFAYWYSYADSTWHGYDVSSASTIQWTNHKMSTFYNERNDAPQSPWPYGIMGFNKDESFVYIYDRYDIWKVSTTGAKRAKKLTKGRKKEIVYRRINLNPENYNIDEGKPQFVRFFNEKDKSSGYAWLNLETCEMEEILKGNFNFSRRVIKAKNNDQIIFRRESYSEFPDLWTTGLKPFDPTKISTANPQQSKFKWGTIKLTSWQHGSAKHTGMIVFPQDFDPKEKYPLIVNFYERSSDRLNNHKTPLLHRSTINYPHYSSKGYIIFNPDIVYKVGDPGKSALDIVVSGTKHLINQGFIQEDKIGIQGHSWGGYQIAHILNHTDIFACAESGAPVVNMISAYGGIRWGSGMSRMFQYERTQSRLGTTLWEDPKRFIRNSPIFNMDQMNTPVLILHNDNDGAVPWYQGIEYYMALRRLNKPAWMLNYRGEPHWPLKFQNRKDFQTRMEQFFDHYLMDKPMPRWMEEGIPAINRGIDLGY